jgi:hypothetical protein
MIDRDDDMRIEAASVAARCAVVSDRRLGPAGAGRDGCG